VSRDKVRLWIKKGELLAINVASTSCARPQLRITAEALGAFEQRRAAAPPPQKPRRRRRAAAIDYYP
jgi:hypothetical protein